MYGSHLVKKWEAKGSPDQAAKHAAAKKNARATLAQEAQEAAQEAADREAAVREAAVREAAVREAAVREARAAATRNEASELAKAELAQKARKAGKDVYDKLKKFQSSMNDGTTRDLIKSLNQCLVLEKEYGKKIASDRDPNGIFPYILRSLSPKEARILTDIQFYYDEPKNNFESFKSFVEKNLEKEELRYDPRYTFKCSKYFDMYNTLFKVTPEIFDSQKKYFKNLSINPTDDERSFIQDNQETLYRLYYFLQNLGFAYEDHHAALLGEILKVRHDLGDIDHFLGASTRIRRRREKTVKDKWDEKWKNMNLLDKGPWRAKDPLELELEVMNHPAIDLLSTDFLPVKNFDEGMYSPSLDFTPEEIQKKERARRRNLA